MPGPREAIRSAASCSSPAIFPSGWYATYSLQYALWCDARRSGPKSYSYIRTLINRVQRCVEKETAAANTQDIMHAVSSVVSLELCLGRVLRYGSTICSLGHPRG